MPWVETESLSFTARHEEDDAAAAQDLLDDLETFRAELAELFPRTPGDIAVIVHPRPWALAIAQPWLPLARLAASPASRRYMAGWFGRREIHVLAPDALEERASPVEGSRDALMLSPLHEYAHIAIALNNPVLPPPFNPGSFARYLRWAWLVEGSAAPPSGSTPAPRGRRASAAPSRGGCARAPSRRSLRPRATHRCSAARCSRCWRRSAAPKPSRALPASSTRSAHSARSRRRSAAPRSRSSMRGGSAWQPARWARASGVAAGTSTRSARRTTGRADAAPLDGGKFERGAAACRFQRGHRERRGLARRHIHPSFRTLHFDADQRAAELGRLRPRVANRVRGHRGGHAAGGEEPRHALVVEVLGFHLELLDAHGCTRHR